MIPKINKILYTTDLSENSAYAFRYAINSAEKHDAQIHVLHAIEPLRHQTTDCSFPFNLEKIHETARQELLNEIKERLEQFCREELKNNPEWLKRVKSIDVIDGHPAPAILAKTDELKPDLLIMGTHSKGFLAHAFLGSVAEKVLNRIKIPVFIIPLPEKADFRSRDVQRS